MAAQLLAQLTRLLPASWGPSLTPVVSCLTTGFLANADDRPRGIQLLHCIQTAICQPPDQQTLDGLMRQFQSPRDALRYKQFLKEKQQQEQQQQDQQQQEEQRQEVEVGKARKCRLPSGQTAKRVRFNDAHPPQHGEHVQDDRDNGGEHHLENGAGNAPERGLEPQAPGPPHQIIRIGMAECPCIRTPACDVELPAGGFSKSVAGDEQSSNEYVELLLALGVIYAASEVADNSGNSRLPGKMRFQPGHRNWSTAERACAFEVDLDVLESQLPSGVRGYINRTAVADLVYSAGIWAPLWLQT